MPEATDRANRALQRFKAYLETLTFIHIDPRLRAKFGLSDIVQKTLIEAWQTLERIEAMDEDAQKRWLRQMLLNNLRDEISHITAQKNNAYRERSREEALERSSCRLGDSLAAEQAKPDEAAIEMETWERVLEALAQLPERQREVVILKQYHNLKLVEIAEYLGCTTNAAAGLHARGLAKLSTILADKE